jgi:hypothetical protein
MPYYEFATIWRLDAPVDRVYALIEDVGGWPRWWPSVLEAREIEAGGEDGLGARWDLTFRGRLPYLLRFEIETVRREPPHTLEGAATGELEGVGAWALDGEGNHTTVRYDWRIRTTRWWMNLFAPLPFVDPIFRLNHHAVMRDGLRGITRELGVAGTYERLD